MASCSSKRKRLFFLLWEQQLKEEEMLLNHLQRNSVHEMYLKRREESCFNMYIKKYLVDSECKFLDYFRITRNLFCKLFSKIESEITKNPTAAVNYPISPVEKLCLFLRYIATGESYASLSIQFRISASYVSIIVTEVCESIINKFLEKEIPSLSKSQLEKAAEQFYERWNFPNAVGALDGKHVRIQAPDNSVVDVGSCGREGDSGIFSKSELGKSIEDGTFPWPDPKPLPRTKNVLPGLILVDGAFKQTSNIMRPFPRDQNSYDYGQQCYNYRHARARRVVENAFGILSQRFQLFFQPLRQDVSNIENIIFVCCILHNMMRDETTDVVDDPDGKEVVLPTTFRPLDVEHQDDLFEQNDGNLVRATLAAYFNSRFGAVQWQRERVIRTE